MQKSKESIMYLCIIKESMQFNSKWRKYMIVISVQTSCCIGRKGIIIRNTCAFNTISPGFIGKSETVAFGDSAKRSCWNCAIANDGITLRYRCQALGYNPGEVLQKLIWVWRIDEPAACLCCSVRVSHFMRVEQLWMLSIS